MNTKMIAVAFEIPANQRLHLRTTQNGFQEADRVVDGESYAKAALKDRTRILLSLVADEVPEHKNHEAEQRLAARPEPVHGEKKITVTKEQLRKAIETGRSEQVDATRFANMTEAEKVDVLLEKLWQALQVA